MKENFELDHNILMLTLCSRLRVESYNEVRNSNIQDYKTDLEVHDKDSMFDHAF